MKKRPTARKKKGYTHGRDDHEATNTGVVGRRSMGNGPYKRRPKTAPDESETDEKAKPNSATRTQNTM